jgi:hypothetical protein
VLPLVLPLRLDDQRRREERDELGKHVTQRFDPLATTGPTIDAVRAVQADTKLRSVALSIVAFDIDRADARSLG